ncbi:hypothetical protein GCM10027589_20290 [Actinocorallia lasiicapitis]
MNLNGYRIVQILGALLFVGMLLLLRTVPATDDTHAWWIALMAVGGSVFAGARWLDERSR